MAGRQNNQQTPRPQGLAPLNPERCPQLLGKYSKLLGKSLKSIDISYTADGIDIGVTGMPGTPYEKLDNASFAAFKAIRDAENAPSTAEKLQSFRNKFELRLNREFPSKEGPVDGSDAAIQEFLNKLPFRERQAMLMTQKQFSARYPNGYTQA